MLNSKKNKNNHTVTRNQVLDIVQKHDGGIHLKNYPKFQNDEEIVIASIWSWRVQAFSWAGQKIQNNKKFILNLIEKLNDPEIYAYLNKKMKKDKEIILSILHTSKNLNHNIEKQAMKTFYCYCPPKILKQIKNTHQLLNPISYKTTITYMLGQIKSQDEKSKIINNMINLELEKTSYIIKKL